VQLDNMHSFFSNVALQTRLQLAHPRVLWEKEVAQANASPWEGDSTEEEARQDHIWERGCEVDYL